ncbi:hypothetical protein [Naasia sp. SYSU D00057]|uniref:hypothetical protein n=1 Tax=Naasia sp. SYSU D00057 TaxID=2817380 RepID=UPI001B30071E|nr:hypothetical protein [Naasia sp. SYSU D00057]
MVDRDDETQEERALRALQSIWAGGDVGQESSKLADEFTDAHTDRLKGWARRRFRPRDPS